MAGGIFVKQGSEWIPAAGGVSVKSFTIYEYLATEGQTAFSGEDLNGLFMSFADGLTQVYLNGVMLSPGDDYSTSSNEVTLLAGAAADDVLNVVAFSSFQSADHYTKSESDAKYATKAELDTAGFNPFFLMGA